MKYYIERPKFSHRNIRKKNKCMRTWVVVKDHPIFAYLMAHPDYLRELDHVGCGLFAYYNHWRNSVELKTVKITQVEYFDPLYDDIWADNATHVSISNHINMTLQMEVSRDAMDFYKEWLDCDS